MLLKSWTEKATILVLELFGGKPQALSSSKTNMAMENEVIFFQRFAEDGDFILKIGVVCHPACRLLICQRLFPQRIFCFLARPVTIYQRQRFD